jgi:hypothetical protein
MFDLCSSTLCSVAFNLLSIWVEYKMVVLNSDGTRVEKNTYCHCLFTYLNETKKKNNRVIIVGIVIGYGLDDGGVGVRVPVVSRIFSSPHHPDWL